MANIVVQEMPFEEKYENVNDAIDLFRDFVPSFVKRHLGPQAERELRRRWREYTEVVAIDAPTDQKYERSYANWIAMARVNFELIRDRMGEEGIEKFVEAEAVQLRRQNSGMAVSMLDMIRAFSRPTAFKMMAKKFAYQTQWITSYETTELTNQIAVFEIPACKVLEYPETEDVCKIGCQRVYPRWLADQFKADMRFDRQGNSCTCTARPLNN
jgi:hypothetical protein